MYFQNQCIQLYAVPVLSILLLMYAVYLFFFYLFYFPFSPILFSLFPFLLFYLSSHCMPSFVPALQYQLLMLFYSHLLVQRFLLLYHYEFHRMSYVLPLGMNMVFFQYIAFLFLFLFLW